MKGIQHFQIKQFTKENITEIEDKLAIEAPLEIQIVRFIEGKWSAKSISITMRTPGNDKALAAGFLFTEGIINAENQIKDIALAEENVVMVQLSETTTIDIDKLDRNFYTTSSCGVCGKTSIDLLRTKSEYNSQKSKMVLEAEKLFDLQDKILNQQSLFSQTGGIHAAALFDINANLIDLQEDVGRHNALDKLLGEAFLKNGIPLQDKILLVSGRASFELVQKATMAGIPIMLAIGAPSSLAIELADEMGMTLVGFLKKEKFNVYCHPIRIKQHGRIKT